MQTAADNPLPIGVKQEMSFQVGQKVVSLATWSAFPGAESVPVKDGIYTVRSIETRGGTGHRLCEISNQPRDWSNGYGEVAFDANHFRPVVEDTDKLEWARKLLEPQALAKFKRKERVEA